MYKYFTIILLLPILLQAKMLISPFDVMKAEFSDKATIVKKNTLLTKKQASKVQAISQVKLSTKIYRTFSATLDAKIVGYGILVSQKVRSKKAALLYLFSLEGEMLGSEIIAFNEPPEFIPSKKWLSQFENTTDKDTLRIGKDIPTITGATMSARSVADSARIARALFSVLFNK